VDGGLKCLQRKARRVQLCTARTGQRHQQQLFARLGPDAARLVYIARRGDFKIASGGVQDFGHRRSRRRFAGRQDQKHDQT